MPRDVAIRPHLHQVDLSGPPAEHYSIRGTFSRGTDSLDFNP